MAQQKVGVNSAVNQEATGTPPGAAPRRLVIGQDVVFNEHIATTAAGQTQLLFLDESSMSIGPNSDLTIDQFVYDPKSSTGKLAMTATQGLLRYVGGKLSKEDGAVTLRTGTATLAVRGGVFIVNIVRGGTTQVIFVFGNALTITGVNGTQTLERPGYEVTISDSGVVSNPTPAPPQQLAQFVSQLDGRAGGNGGAPVIPTNATVVNSGISTTISNNFTASYQQALAHQFNFTPATGTNPTTVQTNLNPQPNTAPQIIDCVSAGTCNLNANNLITVVNNNNNNGGGNNNNPPPTTPTTVYPYAGRLKNTNGHGTANGFVDQSANGDIAYAGGTLSFPQDMPQKGVFTGTFGSLGTISFPLLPGVASFGPQGTSSTIGTFSGTTYLSSDNTFFYATLVPTSQPTERLFVFGGQPVNASFYAPTGNTRVFAFTVQPDSALQSNIPFLRPSAGGNLPNASVSPLYVVAPSNTAIGDASTVTAARALQASLAVNGQGANQQSAIGVTTGTIANRQSNGQPVYYGQFRGSSSTSANGTPVNIRSAVSSTVDGNGNSFYGGNSVSGFVLDQTAYSGNANTGTIGAATIPSTASEVPLSGNANNYGFAQATVPATTTQSGLGSSRTTQTLTGNFGGLMYTTAQPNPYIATGTASIATDAGTNRVQATLSGTTQGSSRVSSVTMQYGGATGTAGGRSAFIDDNNFAALESVTNPQQINGQTLVVNGNAADAGKLYLVSSGAAGAPASLLPSGASYCQCQYLKWGYWGGDLLTGNSSDSSIQQVDRGHINTWVAGVPTPLNDLNSLISQSAVGSYTGHAIGSVFNNGASYMAAGGFNATYNFGTQTGATAITNFDGHNFAASGSAPLKGASYTFTAASPGIKGTVNGTFYGPMAAETGGNFAVQSTVGPAYLASGIFAGKKQ